MLQNEQTKLQVLYQATQAQESALRQQAAELVDRRTGQLRHSLPAGSLTAPIQTASWDSSRHFGPGSMASSPTYIGDNTARLASVS